MAKAAAVVPDKKLLALHKKRAKGHGVDAFIAECVKKNLGFKPELKAYDFAATPELLASAVILFLDAARRKKGLIYVLAAISKKIGKLDLALTADDLRLMAELSLAQGVHSELYMNTIVPQLERFLKKHDGDAKLAKRFAQLVDYHEERRSPRLSDPKLAQRALALRKQLG